MRRINEIISQNVGLACSSQQSGRLGYLLSPRNMVQTNISSFTSLDSRNMVQTNITSFTSFEAACNINWI